MIFKRPGWEMYRHYNPGCGNRGQQKRTEHISAPISDSTTATQQVDDEDSWMELGRDMLQMRFQCCIT